MKIFLKNLPELCDLKHLKVEIGRLSEKEKELPGDVRLEYHCHLQDIWNLHRLLRSLLLDKRERTSSYFISLQSELLSSHWDKLRNSIDTAGSYFE